MHNIIQLSCLALCAHKIMNGRIRSTNSLVLHPLYFMHTGTLYLVPSTGFRTFFWIVFDWSVASTHTRAHLHYSHSTTMAAAETKRGYCFKCIYRAWCTRKRTSATRCCGARSCSTMTSGSSECPGAESYEVTGKRWISRFARSSIASPPSSLSWINKIETIYDIHFVHITHWHICSIDLI